MANQNQPNPLNGDDPSQAKWQTVYDVNHKRWYYVDDVTKKVSWDQPEGCSVPLPTSPPPGADDLDNLPSGWRAYYDPNSRKMCFQNTQTQATQWERPAPPQSTEAATNGITSAEPKVEASKEQKASEVANSAASDWEPRWDPTKKRWCYVNEKTKQHQYDKKPDGFTKDLPTPPELPPGWTAAWDNTHNKFYFLSPEKKAQWEPPALQTTNGQTTNGQTTNGQTTNGQTTNGLTTNGQTTPPIKAEETKVAPEQQKEAQSPDNAQEVLPPGWDKAFNKDYQRYYYFNREKNLTQWQSPNDDEKKPDKTGVAAQQTATDTANKAAVERSPDEAKVEDSSGKAETNSATVTAPSEASPQSPPSPNKDKAVEKKLGRTALETLANLVLKDEPKENLADIDVKGLLTKFWRDRQINDLPADETTLEEFLVFIGFKEK